MIIFRALLFFFVIASTSSANSSEKSIEDAYGRLLWTVFNIIDREDLVSSQVPSSCDAQTQKVRQDGKIDITAVFGYMDVSGGQDFNQAAADMFGQGVVLDRPAKKEFITLLTGSCYNTRSSACEFKKKGKDKLVKTIRDRWTNQKLKVTIQISSPSLSISNQANSSSSKQKKTSDKTQSVFLKGLQSADAVIYMGHARSGGGPDFYPPRLTSGGQVNYSHYKSQQPGIRSMLGALRGSHKPAFIGVLACKSTGLFSGWIRKAAPGSTLVTAHDLFDFDDIVPTGYAMIEAILSQQCGREFDRLVRASPGSRQFLKISR